MVLAGKSPLGHCVYILEKSSRIFVILGSKLVAADLIKSISLRVSLLIGSVLFICTTSYRSLHQIIVVFQGRLSLMKLVLQYFPEFHSIVCLSSSYPGNISVTL